MCVEADWMMSFHTSKASHEQKRSKQGLVKNMVELAKEAAHTQTQSQSLGLA